MNKVKKYQRSIFLDTSDVKVIKEWNRTGVIDGVTTNPQIMLNEGVTKKSYFRIIEDICAEMKGKSVSVELTSNRKSYDALVKEAVTLGNIASNITIKIPLDPSSTDSLALIHYLAIDKKMSVNATILMNYEQLALATQAIRGAKKPSFVSLFWGRSIEDWSLRSGERYSPDGLRMGSTSWVDGDPVLITKSLMKLVNITKNVYLIVGSVRNAAMVGEAMSADASVVTVPPDILRAMMFSRRGVETLEQFDKAWEELDSKK